MSSTPQRTLRTLTASPELEQVHREQEQAGAITINSFGVMQRGPPEKCGFKRRS